VAGNPNVALETIMRVILPANYKGPHLHKIASALRTNPACALWLLSSPAEFEVLRYRCFPIELEIEADEV